MQHLVRALPDVIWQPGCCESGRNGIYMCECGWTLTAVRRGNPGVSIWLLSCRIRRNNQTSINGGGCGLGTFHSRLVLIRERFRCKKKCHGDDGQGVSVHRLRAQELKDRQCHQKMGEDTEGSISLRACGKTTTCCASFYKRPSLQYEEKTPHFCYLNTALMCGTLCQPRKQIVHCFT